jgi:hypothetical protein
LLNKSKHKEIYSQHLVIKPLDVMKSPKKEYNNTPIFVQKCLKASDFKSSQFFENGAKLDLSFAIDFTISNGNFMKGEPSMHDRDMTKNLYKKVMEYIGPTLEKHQKKNDFIKLMGFGAKVRKLNQKGSLIEDLQVSDMIDIYNFYPGMQGVVNSYESMLPQLGLSGPTCFNKVISEVNNKQVDHEMIYKVLTIITDGEPNDLRATIDAIVVSSHKPISIVIMSVARKLLSPNDKKEQTQNFGVLKDLASGI